jgi:hypothetical protein
MLEEVALGDQKLNNRARMEEASFYIQIRGFCFTWSWFVFIGAIAGLASQPQAVYTSITTSIKSVNFSDWKTKKSLKTKLVSFQ